MRFLARVAIIAVLLGIGMALMRAGAFSWSSLSVQAQSAAPQVGDQKLFLPRLANFVAHDVARAFSSDQSGVLASGGGHILAVGPNSVPTYQDGSSATLALSIDVDAVPPVAPPAWLNIVSPPVIFGPSDFTFNFPLTVRMPVAGVTDVSDLFFVRYGASGAWTRDLFAFDPENPTAIEATLFSLGPMAVGEYELGTAALRPQGGLYVPNTHCPIGGMQCFYYLTIQSFVPKYADEAPAGSFAGYPLRTRSNVTGESPEPTGWLLPQGTYNFCYSALEAPLTLSNLKKYINPNPQTVVIDEPYACDITRRCFTEVRPVNQPGWIEARDDRPCQMGVGIEPDDPATLGLTGDFQITLRWKNTSESATDLDLHLHGPSGLHVWYVGKLSADGSLRLDRDWRTAWGDAVENIYQVKDSTGKSIAMPAGSYTIQVVHYAGASNKPYEVRVIRNGAVTNFSGTLSAGATHELMTFNVP